METFLQWPDHKKERGGGICVTIKNCPPRLPFQEEKNYFRILNTLVERYPPKNKGTM